MKKGYVTVYFSIILSVCISLIYGLIFGVRENAMRLRVRDAVDISVRSSFGDYQKELWDRYRLLFVDAGYGSDSSSMIIPEERLAVCVNKNLSGAHKGTVKDLLKLKCSIADTEAVRLATDNGGQAVKSQAVKIIKQAYGIDYIEKIENELIYARDSNLFDAKPDIKINESINGYEEEFPEFYEWKSEIESGIFEEKELSLYSSLNAIFRDNLSDISKNTLIKEVIAENRSLNIGNYSKTNESDITEDLLFKEYVLAYCNNYTNPDDSTVLKYETEYLLVGNMCDAENLEGVVNRLLLLREVSNICTLESDTEKMESIRSFAEIAAAICLAPELAPELEALIVTGWSYFESISDIRILLNGGKVPLIKSPGEWKSGMMDIFNRSKSYESFEEGLTYKEYLRCFLSFTGTDKVLTRFVNLCEANVRNDCNNPYFRMDNCFDAWKVTIYINSEWDDYYLAKREIDIEK